MIRMITDNDYCNVIPLRIPRRVERLIFIHLALDRRAVEDH
jgi:hypothetical protein